MCSKSKNVIKENSIFVDAGSHTKKNDKIIEFEAKKLILKNLNSSNAKATFTFNISQTKYVIIKLKSNDMQILII